MFVTKGVDPSGLRMHRVNSKAIKSLTATNIQKRNNCFKQKNRQVGSYQYFQLDRHWKDLIVAHQDITTDSSNEATRAYVAAAGTAAISGLARPQAGKLKLQGMRKLF